MFRRRCLIATLLLTCGSSLASAAGLSSLELLGATALAGSTQIDGVPLGGLSGLAFDAQTGSYLALSDDRSEKGPARFYRLAIELPAAGTAATSPVVAVEGAVTLVGPGGKPFPRRGVDRKSVV